MKKIICCFVAFCCILSVFCSSPSLYAMDGGNRGEVHRDHGNVNMIIRRALPFAILFGCVKIVFNIIKKQGTALYYAFLDNNVTHNEI